MRQAFITVLVALALLVGNMAALAYSQLSDMELVAESDSLALYVDMSTTEIALVDKRSGNVWYSNPVGDRADAVRHQISISYYSPDGMLRTLENYKDSVALGQFSIERLDNGVRIYYVLGKKWNDNQYIPQLIPGDMFESDILSRIEKASDEKLILERFIPISLQKAPPDIVRTKVEVDKKALFGDYVLVSPAIKNLDDREKMIWDLLGMLRTNRLDIEVIEDVTAEDLAFLIDNEVYMAQSMPAFVQRNVVAALKGAGYTPEKAQEAHLATGLDPYQPNIEVFEIPIEYSIDGDEFIARIPVGEIVYPVYEGEMVFNYQYTSFTIKDPKMPIASLRLLEYFGAGNAANSGYIFVPDGSGALIDFRDAEAAGAAYISKVYGVDQSIEPIISKPLNATQTYLPVFGLVKDGSAIFGIVESGDALTSIRAAIASTSNKYHRVLAELTPAPVTQVKLFSTTSKGFYPVLDKVTKYQARMYQGDFTVRYSFLSGDDANYVGMAKRYREYLIEHSGLQRVQAGSDIPLYIELIGAVGLDRPFLGFQTEVSEPLTTFAEALSIVQELSARGITDLNLRYSGWLRKGLVHAYPDGVYLEKALGSKRDLDALNQAVESINGRLFPSVGFLEVQSDSLLDGFSARRDAARYLSNELVRTFDYDMVSGVGVQKGYLLSPSRLADLVERFMSDYVTLGIGSIALDQIGEAVYSHFSDEVERLVDRQQSRNKVAAVVKRIREDYGLEIAVDGANAYVLPYVDHILNMPVTSNDLYITTKAVPFYQIVVHGFVSYSGGPINLSSNHRWNMLKTIETGGYPYYVLCYRDSTILKDTPYHYLYSIGYEQWKGEMVEFYERANEVLAGLQDQAITYHAEVAPNVFATGFENGARVVVNYRSEPAVIDGVTIPAQDFILVAEDESHE